jgi:hypothetical protein
MGVRIAKGGIDTLEHHFKENSLRDNKCKIIKHNSHLGLPERMKKNNKNEMFFFECYIIVKALRATTWGHIEI